MGSWVKRQNEWLPRRTQREDALLEDQQAEVKEENNISTETIIHIPIKCPRTTCKSRKVHCYGSSHPVLYYKCQICGEKFKVIEKD